MSSGTHMSSGATGTFGRVILPLGKYRRAANVPGEQPVYPIQFEFGEPGVKQGQ